MFHQLTSGFITEAAGTLAPNYQIGSRLIRYEMRLGTAMEAPPSAEDLAVNPDLPTHDVDVRVLDSDGRPFLVQMAGHAFLDTNWKVPRIEGFDERGRMDDFELLTSAVADFRTLALPSSLDRLRHTGIQVGLATWAPGCSY